MNNELRIRFMGHKDRAEKDYYVAHVHLPVSMALQDVTLRFFPDEDDSDPSKFGGDLVVKLPDRPVQKDGRPVGPKRERSRPTESR